MLPSPTGPKILFPANVFQLGFAQCVSPLFPRMHSADDQGAPPRPSGWLPRHRDAPEVQRSRMLIFLSSSYFCVHVNLFPARFMLKHLAGLLAPPTPEGRSSGPLVPQLQQKFPLLVFSCLQLSSKLLLHSHVGQPVSYKLPSRSCD